MIIFDDLSEEILHVWNSNQILDMFQKLIPFLIREGGKTIIRVLIVGFRVKRTIAVVESFDKMENFYHNFSYR
jgi:hypothetical protein